EIQETHPKHRKLDSQTALPHRARGRVSDGVRPTATCNGSRLSCPRVACMCTESRTGLPAYIRSAVTRYGFFVSCAARTLRMPTAWLPGGGGQGRVARCPFRSTRTCCAMPVGLSSPTMATTHGRCSTTSATGTSSIRPVHRNGARAVQGLLERLTLGLGHLG